MYKLSAYYHASAKKELPYYGAEKSAEEIHQILIDAHLYPDEDLLELVDDLPDYYDAEEIVINEEEELEMDNILNLDEFVNTLEDIIEDSNFEEDNEAEDLAEESQEKNNNDITWDPALK